MGRIIPLSTLRVEDFDSEQRSWLPRLFTPLNLFFTSVSGVLNGQIQFGSNIASQDQVFSFTYSGNPQLFTWNISMDPAVLWVGQAYESGTLILVSPLWQFNASSRIISVNFIKSDGSALTMGTNYQITVRAVP